MDLASNRTRQIGENCLTSKLCSSTHCLWTTTFQITKTVSQAVELMLHVTNFGWWIQLYPKSKLAGNIQIWATNSEFGENPSNGGCESRKALMGNSFTIKQPPMGDLKSNGSAAVLPVDRLQLHGKRAKCTPFTRGPRGRQQKYTPTAIKCLGYFKCISIMTCLLCCF